jgi:hypothetical protein
MIKLPVVAFLLGTNLLMESLRSATLPSADLPFTITASENVSSDFPGAPRIQSFSFAQWRGRWVFIGGRKAGYHGVGGESAEFSRAEANSEVWVVDTTVHPARTYHVPVDALPPALTLVKDQWTSTAQLYFQDGEKLYISGGYGQDYSGKWTTFPLISQIDLPNLIDGVMHGRLSAGAVAYAKTPLVQSSGGALIKLQDGYFYLVMGHSFDGNYTAFEGQNEQNTAVAAQKYLNEIRKLKVANNGAGQLSVSLVEKFEDPAEFHRRDLNAAQTLSPQGLGLAAYGGVFTPDTQLNFSKPVYLFPASGPAVDGGFAQKMNAYSCPTLLLYDKAFATMYTTFFGGISRYSWEAGKFVENARTGGKTEATYLDGMQWSDQISTVRRVMARGREETTEFVQRDPLPGWVGTGAVFIPLPEVLRAQSGTDILDLQALRGTNTLVGHIYGGIRAYPFRFPYNKTAAAYNAGTVPTQPSELILKVYLQVPR